MAAHRRRFGHAEGGQRLALGESQLQLHQIHARHFLGDGVLHLQPRVGFDEVERLLGRLPGYQELESAQAAVAAGGGQLAGRGRHAFPNRRRQRWRGGHLDDLLVAALKRAVPIAEAADAAVAIRRHLHFHMAGVGQELLHVDVRNAEGRLRLGLGAGEGFVDFVNVPNDAHAAPATTPGGFEQHRRACRQIGEEALGCLDIHRCREAGRHRHVVLLGQAPGLRFVAEQRERSRRGPHELQARRFARTGEGGVLAEEAVARVYGVAARLLPGPHHFGDVQVGRRASAGEGDGFIRLPHVQGAFVLFGVHGHRGNVQFRRGAGDADGDFAPVGDQQPHWQANLGVTKTA